MDSTDLTVAEIEEEININEKELKLPNHKSVKILRNVMLVIKQLVAMLGFYVFTFCIANNTSIIAEESRFETWQQGRPFTIGAMYYDGPYGPPAQLPAPEDAQPDMALFRYAGLNMLDEVSWTGIRSHS